MGDDVLWWNLLDQSLWRHDPGCLNICEVLLIIGHLWDTVWFLCNIM